MRRGRRGKIKLAGSLFVDASVVENGVEIRPEWNGYRIFVNMRFLDRLLWGFSCSQGIRIDHRFDTSI